jgi:hypothetical protein
MDPDWENMENQIQIHPFNISIKKKNTNMDICIDVFTNTNLDI